MGNKNIQAVKVILPGNKCPHCEKEIMISAAMTTPYIEWILRPEDINAVKDRLKSYLRELDSDSDEKQKLEAWLDSPDTLISPDEVESLKSQIAKSIGNDSKETKTDQLP